MPDYSIIVTPSAEEDMLNIFDFISADNRQKALETIDKFEKQFEMISMFPDIGCKKSSFVMRDVREWTVAKHYQIIYYKNENIIYILRVLTGYEDYFYPI